VFAALCTAIHGHAFALDLGEKTANPLDALEKAKSYSVEDKQSGLIKIGIIISFGKQNAVSADDVGTAFVTELANRGHEARYFYYETNRNGGALSFHIADVVLGAWDANNAASRINEVTTIAEGANKVQKVLNQ
jgi:hypothetical protein